ncbi:MAG: TetR/AcrR family transcriptional regulator [Gammaproteobacteria bacterium]|nr:TetR/AcrR family transcriptional regulator [Gammaproteobacteria bacterium]
MTNDADKATSALNQTEEAILDLTGTEPLLGQAAIADRLRDQGLQISASGVRYILQKHGLETAPKRLQALLAGGTRSLTPDETELLERGKRSGRLRAVSDGNGSEDGEDAASRQERIINAAAELFATQGYDRTSMRDIARQVGLLPGSVYHYFPSKEELYQAIHRAGFEGILAKLNQAAAEGKDPWDKLRLVCRTHVTAMLEGAPIHRVTGHGLALVGDNALLDKIRDARDAHENVFRELIEQLPLAPHVDRGLLRLSLLGSINWIVIWYRPGGGSTPVEIADAMVDMIRLKSEAD